MQPGRWSATPEVFPSSADLSTRVTRAARRGELRRIHGRIYTTNLADPLELVVRRHRWRVVDLLFPGAVVTHRSALAGDDDEQEEGTVFLTGGYDRIVRLPGLRVRQMAGPGPLSGDRLLEGSLHIASTARALLECLLVERVRGEGSPSLPLALLRSRVEGIAAEGPGGRTLLRDAGELAAPLRAGAAVERLGHLLAEWGLIQPGAAATVRRGRGAGAVSAGQAPGVGAPLRRGGSAGEEAPLGVGAPTDAVPTVGAGPEAAPLPDVPAALDAAPLPETAPLTGTAPLAGTAPLTGAASLAGAGGVPRPADAGPEAAPVTPPETPALSEAAPPPASARPPAPPWDTGTIRMLEALREALASWSPPPRTDLVRSGNQWTTLAFLDAWSSCALEGRAFDPLEVERAVFHRRVAPGREGDVAVLLGTWRLLASPVEMTFSARDRSAEGFVTQLHRHHRGIFPRRSHFLEGESGEEVRAGSVDADDPEAVAPERVHATLLRGYDLYRTLGEPLRRAAFLLVLLSATRPFPEGTGVVARATMNAELIASGERRILFPPAPEAPYLPALDHFRREADAAPLLRLLEEAQGRSAALEVENRLRAATQVAAWGSEPRRRFLRSLPYR